MHEALDATGQGSKVRRHCPLRRREMILATTKVEDFDRFLNIFSTRGAEKRRQPGSKGTTVFRDPVENDWVWVLFDWDGEGWQSICHKSAPNNQLEEHTK
jgi:hypothetical protein